MSDRADWHARRRTGIGGSDVAALLGVDRFRSPLDLWRLKRGLAQPDAGNDATRHGQACEPWILRALSERYGLEVGPGLEFVRHPRWDAGVRLLANLDGTIPGGIVEAKTTRSMAQAEALREGRLPASWALQVHHYAACTGRRFGVLACLHGATGAPPEEGDLIVVRWAAQPELIALIERVAAAWWRDHVEGDRPPEYTWHPDADEAIRLVGQIKVTSVAPLGAPPKTEKRAMSDKGEIGQLVPLAQAAAKSRFYRDLDEPRALIVCALGQAMGLSPALALSSIHVIDGKPTLGATAQAALVKRSGRYDYRVREHTDERCRIEFFERGGAGGLDLIGESIYTTEDAKRAGLLGRGPWKSYPRAMLFARALTAGVRWHCPDVLGGAVYDPDEMGSVEVVAPGGAPAHADAETVIEAEVSPRPSSKVPMSPKARFWSACNAAAGRVDVPPKALADAIRALDALPVDQWTAERSERWCGAISTATRAELHALTGAEVDTTRLSAALHAEISRVAVARGLNAVELKNVLHSGARRLAGLAPDAPWSSVPPRVVAATALELRQWDARLGAGTDDLDSLLAGWLESTPAPAVS